MDYPLEKVNFISVIAQWSIYLGTLTIQIEGGFKWIETEQLSGFG
jgi:hypothetical protein